MRIRSTKTLAVSACSVALLSAVGCSSGSSNTASDSSMNKQTTDSMSSPMKSTMPNMAAQLVGSGCAKYAKMVPSGAGSVSGMASDPVAVAASHNPLLKTLVAAVSGKVNPKVNLVDTLDGGQFTVFAPTDTAFAKLPKSTVASLAMTKNAAELQSILTYHVLPGQITPDAIAGTHKSVEGESLKVTGSGDHLMVNGIPVICGGVQTANATVYLIGSVLAPPSMS
jgi:uncharacterized surface protein with fasciclin (FAS1) repeats